MERCATADISHTSTLIQLAEVAERKQEEEDEMMDTGGATPGGTPTPGSPSATPPPLCIQEQPSSTTQLELHGELSKIPTSLTPRSIFKKTASQAQSLPPTPHRDVDLPSCSVPLSSPLTSLHVKYVPAPTPSPDSAIHST